MIFKDRSWHNLFVTISWCKNRLKSDDVQEIVNPARQILKKWINDQLAESEKN